MHEKMVVGEFQKVSFDEFQKSFNSVFGDKGYNVEKIYEEIGLPFRATKDSAGYDFFTPISFTLKPGETILIPTGIRVKIIPNWALFMLPKSGLGFKFRLQLDNTIGLIDGDYYYSDNEGHIMAKVTNDSHSEKVVDLESGRGFMQGVFMPYGVIVDDKPGVKPRNGGMDSTLAHKDNK